MIKKFAPSSLLKNKHVQTLYSSLFRKLKPLKLEVEKYTLEDGDFLECYWYNKPITHSNTPIVILFHGLAGSYKSPYIQGAMQELQKNGFSIVVMHFRGSSGVDNKLPRSYHSGETGDALSWLRSLQTRYPRSKLFGVGYSLGGNMLLKLLGENPDTKILEAAISVSAPIELDSCADKMDTGFSKFYQYILLKELKKSLTKKFEKHPMEKYLTIERKDIKNLKTFWSFDEAYTAPIHQFSSAKDYYTKSSAKQFLKYITTPTLVIHAEDDPFMKSNLLKDLEINPLSTKLESYPNGGHVGFINGSFFKPEFWLEKRINDYFDTYK